jgi:hypothetical protein
MGGVPVRTSQQEQRKSRVRSDDAHHDDWAEETAGRRSMTVNGFRLEIWQHNGFARWLILEPLGTRGQATALSSGSEGDLAAAMAVATHTTMRFGAVMARRKSGTRSLRLSRNTRGVTPYRPPR